MRIYFSGIGGTAIGPLALIAKQAGFEVLGSDKQDSQYIDYLGKHGINNVHIGQTRQAIEAVHDKTPIDWLVYSSAVEKENADHPELQFAREQNIKCSKRDELINLILQEKNLKLVAIAGTHGKTTTTAMVVWLYKQLDLPVSYSVGAKINFGDMGQYQASSQYFVYEADEFDRNFLAFKPHISLITGVTWDHHEIFPTREDYQQAFREFIDQSNQTFIWQEDFDYLSLPGNGQHHVLDSSDNHIHDINLAGLYNRLDGWLAVQAVHDITHEPVDKLIELINLFPGSQRRMELLVNNLYSDYAHTPDKIRGAMNIALEMAAENNQKLIVVYEPLTNRRQHHMIEDYQDCFDGADHVYWVPSYLAREDPSQRIILPSELISHLTDPTIASPTQLNSDLKQTIQIHLGNGDMVVAMSGGGGNSLDEWLRREFAQ
jgi:UDP-N-acetylmuramate--alanine ligase